MYPQQIIDALRHVRYPGTGKDLIESGMLEDDIRISGLEVSFSLIFEKDNDPFMKSVVKAAEVAIETYVDANHICNHLGGGGHAAAAGATVTGSEADVRRRVLDAIERELEG